MQKSFGAKMWQNIGNYLNVVLLSTCYQKLILSCLLVCFSFAEPSNEVEEGEQDEAGWTRYGRVPRIELREKQLVIQR